MGSMENRMLAWLISASALLMFWHPGKAAAQEVSGDVFPTYGVHNDSHKDRCAHPDCAYPRAAGEPTDPIYPPYWSSHWVMYRVFNRFREFPPPYDGKPPTPLQDGKDY